MSRQATLDTFFAVRKRHPDAQAAKKRKLAYPELITPALPQNPPKSAPSESRAQTQLPRVLRSDEGEPLPQVSELTSVTSVLDDHVLLKTPSFSSGSASESTRNHKRDSFGRPKVDVTPEAQKADPKFTLGQAGAPGARKRLDMGPKATRSSSRVGFVKMGQLSPKKVEKTPKVTFAKVGLLSPQKKKPVSKAVGTAPAVAAVKVQVQRLTPEEIKAKLGKVGQLSELKARMAKLNQFKIPPKSPGKALMPPRLTHEAISLDIQVPCSPTKVRTASPMKASPRKTAISDHFEGMDEDLPIPTSYKFLGEVFRTLDHIVSIKFNRREVIRVLDLKSAVQTALKRNFSDKYLKQIKCVFPQAYKFAWEKLIGKFGLKKEDYELHMLPNITYLADLTSGVVDSRLIYEAARFSPLTPKHLVERRSLFKKLLISMVKDHHSRFLASLNPPILVENDKLRRWHKEFEVESCPEVDMEDLPEKPNVVKICSAQDVLHAKRDLFGINNRLANALQEQATKAEEADKSEVKVETTAVKKGLEGLPPALIERIMAKEKAKQIRDMVENSDERKESEMLEELILLGPKVINCYKSEKQRQNKAALEINDFIKLLADSYGKSSIKEMDVLVRYLIKLTPEFFQILVLRKIEYLKMRGGSPDLNALVAKIKILLAEKNKV